MLQVIFGAGRAYQILQWQWILYVLYYICWCHHLEGTWLCFEYIMAAKTAMLEISLNTQDFPQLGFLLGVLSVIS
jgi:hypothetical protein